LKTARAIDPITLEVLWSRLISIVDEAAATLLRTSFSIVVRESSDFSCVLTDASGNSLVQSTRSIPSFIGTLPRTVKYLSGQFPPETLGPGDVLVTNDLYMGTGHLPDISLARPIDRDGRLVAWAASVAHSPDIGGRIRNPESAEVFEEGLQIPPLKLLRAEQPNRDLFRILRKNVRVPDEVEGDVWAQVAALRIAERRLGEMMDEHGLADLDRLASAIQETTEEAMRRAIRELPAGVYPASLSTDGLAVPIDLRAAVRVDGDAVSVDYAGSSGQVDRALNCAPCYRDAFTMFAFKCALAAEVPNNEGAFRPIAVDAPPGSILNPLPPAAGGTRLMIGHYLPSLVHEALAPLIPERVRAATGSPAWCVNLAGPGRGGRRFATMFFLNGGYGAAATEDGWSALSFPSNISNTPCEVVEALVPFRVEAKELVCDSGGPGRHRGGLGQRVALRCLSAEPITVALMAERTLHPARGLFGGRPGAPGGCG
jgi:N-methylhydantoinase B